MSTMDVVSYSSVQANVPRRDMDNYVSSDLYGDAHTQGAMTLIVRADTVEMKARTKRSKNRYPNLGDDFDLHVQEFDLIIGPKKAGTNNQNFVWGFSSINGLPFGTAETVEELENKYWFIGVSRSNHYVVPNLAKGTQVDKQGFGVIAFGICSIRQCWEKDMYAGDVAMWRFPTVAEALEMINHKTTTRYAPTKLMVKVVPLDWSRIKYSINNVCKLFLRKANDIGISNKLSITQGEYGSSNSESTANIRAARAFKNHALTTVATGVEVLATRNLVEILTPYKVNRKNAQTRLLISALDLIKTLLPRGRGNLTANNLAPMDINGTPFALNGSMAEVSTQDETGQFLRDYIAFSEACAEPKTDASKMVNCAFSDEYEQPYVWFTHGADFNKRIKKGLEKVDLTSESSAKSALLNEKMRKVHEILFLTNMLGLTNGGKGEELNVTHDVLNATHLSMTDAEVGKKYLKPHAFGPEFSVVTTSRQVAMLKEYKNHAEVHLPRLGEEMGKLCDSIHDKKIGRFVSHASAGSLNSVADLLVGGF